MTHPALAGGPIYLDYNATTPVDPAVLQAALPYLSTHFGNPSSGHHYAHAPRHALDQARGRVAALLGAASEEIVFTGGGSEADTLAVRGAALAASGRRQIITLATEHPAVLESCHSLCRDGDPPSRTAHRSGRHHHSPGRRVRPPLQRIRGGWR